MFRHVGFFALGTAGGLAAAFQQIDRFDAALCRIIVLSLKGGHAMGHDFSAGNQCSVRGTDSNSLMRLYDQARALLAQSPFSQERLKAERVVQRITKELKRRNILLEIQ